MIINKGPVEKAEVIGNVDTSNSMRMNLNAQSYELLLSNLYSDPLGSTIRELCTNAVEANIASKTTKKVVVQLPSIINSNLIIRDFGTGLDDKEIDKYLNCLFSSSKGESNDSMGGFGLGSKSPLALVDSFYLSSVKDGIQYDYMWIKERGQIPTPIFQGSEKVTKENGITITVPLGSSSKIPLHNLTSHVKTAANRQLFGFKDQVMIVTDATVPYDKMTDVTASTITWKAILETPHLTIFTKDVTADLSSHSRFGSSYGNVESYIRVGSVVYRYGNNLDFSSLGNYIKNLHKFVIVIDVPIGQLDIPMSREEVNTTSDNSRIINKYLVEGKKAIEQEYRKIPFDFNVGAVDFHKQIKKYSNNTQINWNVSADRGKLIAKDSALIQKLLDYVQKYNSNYSTITVTDFLGNLNGHQLYEPIEFYAQRVNSLLNKTHLKVSSVNTSGFTSSNGHFSDNTVTVFLPSKLPFGVRLGDLYSYYKNKYPKKQINTVCVYQYKVDYDKPDELIEYFKTVYECRYEHRNMHETVFDGDTDLEDLKDFVKTQRSVNKTTVLANDFVVGTRIVKLDSKYHEIEKNGDGYVWKNSNSTNKDYRVNKLLDSKGKTISVGADYVEDFDRILLTTTADVPLKSNSSFNVLNKTEIDVCLKNSCILKVSENSYEKVKESLDKAGLDFNTKDDPFEIKVPPLEELLEKSPTDIQYKEAMFYVLSSELSLLFVSNYWRTDKTILKERISNFLDIVKDSYPNKNSFYYKFILQEHNTILTRISTNSLGRPCTYSYNLKEVTKFKEEVTELLLNNLVINRSSWLKDYNLLSYYHDNITRKLFNKFGYNT